MPITVTITVTNSATIIDWPNKSEAVLFSFLPRVLDISAVVPAEIPTLAAMIIRYIGKDLTIAVYASGAINPANFESTKLYIVWKKVPILAGIAIFFNNEDKLSLVKSMLTQSKPDTNHHH